MNRIAVIGIGIMGHGIADNFLKNGYQVIIWNRSPAKTDDLVKKGAKLAKSIKEATESADIVFEVTANDDSSRQIWLGKDGTLTNANTAQYLVACSTLSVGWTDELAELCSGKNLNFFDIPMTGGRIGAEIGQLTLLAGGNKEKLKEIEPDLKAISKEVKYFGKAGSGMRYKLILNSLQAIHIASLGEMLRMADELGLDKNLVGNALAERPGGVITNLAWDGFQSQPDPINFSIEWITKDLNYAHKMLQNTPHPFILEALNIYQSAIELGLGSDDWTKINQP